MPGPTCLSWLPNRKPGPSRPGRWIQRPTPDRTRNSDLPDEAVEGLVEAGGAELRMKSAAPLAVQTGGY